MTYCPHHDPILRAGFITCDTCRRIAYPTDADWLDEDLVLASYPAPCCHARAVVLLVRPSQITAADFDPDMHVPGRRCAGSTRRGRPCRAQAQPGSDYCMAHRPSRIEAA